MASIRMNSVKLVHKVDGKADIPICVLSYKEGQTLADFRLRIVDVCEFDFVFWDDRLPGRVKRGVEKLIELSELEGKVYVVEEESNGMCATRFTQLSSHSSVRIGTLSTPETSSHVEDVQVDELNSEILPSLVRASFESCLMPERITKLWTDEWKRLETAVKKSGKNDHKWRVKTWDEGTEVRAHLECLECRDQYGNPDQCLNPKSISNVFNNFFRKHLCHTKHLDNYKRRRGLPLKESLISAIPIFDHGQAIDVGGDIIQKLNKECDPLGLQKVFGVTPDINAPEYRDKSFLFKVRCSICGKLHTDLCPKKLNLEHNLRTHLVSREHVDALETVENITTLEIRSGKRGRPRKPDLRDLHPSQNSILKFFKEDDSKASSSSARGIPECIDPGLSLLCWGLWSEFVKYRGPSLGVKSILNDQSGGTVWDLEPNTNAVVFNPSTDSVVNIEGCFRHKLCSRLSILGGGFEHLTCSYCMSISLQDDFRGRVHREAEALVRRGDRTTALFIRLDYLTKEELSAQVKNLNALRRKERWLLSLQAQKVCALTTKKKQLEDLLGVAADRKDLRLFLRCIVNGHRSGAFGGKEGLWDFLKDVARNLSRSEKGFRYSARTKAISQAMLQFGGRQVAHCFARNLSAPSLKTLKRDRSKLVPFRTGLQKETFKEVAKVLSAAKNRLGIVGDVPVIFAEDETRIKERPRWEAKYDSLIGFCGTLEDHKCSFGMEVIVGDGEDGYNKIVSTFDQYKKGMYARVVIVNPLHESLPKLAICALPTCNSFKAEWVREHWNQLKLYWDECCREVVGPLLGHASDGDARRRKLMLEDYRGAYGKHPRYNVGWEGWQYSISILPNGDLYGFGDQDQPHNGKKLINPLDRVSSVLALGDQHAALSYVSMVYNQYPIHVHGLNWDDVNRSDRQNWAGPQRIAARKVQKCLRDMFDRQDDHHERTLGTELYLEICGDYNDIFYSPRHDIRSRIVLASKVSWFFRLWRLWIHYGDHSVGGNVVVHTEKNMISVQAFHDVNMSCHFIVLLICAFRDKFSHLPVPFHLLGSDCCEIFFSKVGGMSGHERNYDFGSLLDSAVGLNRLAGLEYGPEGLKVGRSHKKQDHVWGRIHGLQEGEISPDLLDYSLIQSNEQVIVALKEGLDCAKTLLCRLQMSPRSSLPIAKRRWWLSPWDVEAKTWPDVAVFEEAVVTDDSETLVLQSPLADAVHCGEFHELQDPEEDLNRMDEWITNESLSNIDESVVAADPDFALIHDPIAELETLGHEVRHVFGSIVQDLSSGGIPKKIVPYVTYGGKEIYKSTLVSELVGNPHLSKDRLTRVKQGQYQKGGKRKACDMNVATCIVDVGSDCAILFETASDVAGPSTRSSNSKKGKKKGKKVSRMEEAIGKAEFWLGRVIMMRQKYSGQWGRVRTHIDLMDRPTPAVGQSNSICQLLFNWYKPIGNQKIEYAYNTTDLQWIDVEMVISNVNLTLKRGTINHIYVLDAVDKQALDTYLQTIAKEG